MKHHYTLHIRGDGRASAGDSDHPAAVQLTLRPRPYPRRVVDRPLTLYPAMLQADLKTRVLDQPAGQAALNLRFGVLSSIEAGVALSLGQWDGDGVSWGRAVTPHVRIRMAEQSALDLVYLPASTRSRWFRYRPSTRISLVHLTQMGQRLMTFRLYERAMDPFWPGDVATASTEFGVLGLVRHQLSDATFVSAETGLEINAYEFSSTAWPVDLQFGYVLPRGVDLGLTGGVQDLLSERPSYHFGIAVSARIGGD